MSFSPPPSAPRQPQQQSPQAPQSLPPSQTPQQSPQSQRWQRPGQPQQRPERGIPDGLIVGLLAVLLGTTALFWAATELGGLVSHGRFPRPLPFLSTAGAIRHLATAPNDLAGAWPGTPAATLPSAAAFWFTFFALLALVLLLLLSAATARAKRRAVRAAHEARVPAEGTGGTGRMAGMRDATGTEDGPGPADRTGTPVGPPGQRRGPGPLSAGNRGEVPAGPPPSRPADPGTGVTPPGDPGAPGPGSSGLPGLPEPARESFPGVVTHAQAGRAAMGGAAAPAWEAGQPDVPFPGANPSASDIVAPRELDDASSGGGAPAGGTLGLASLWSAGRPATVTGPATDGRVVPQGNGSRTDPPRRPGMPSVADAEVRLPADGVDAFAAGTHTAEGTATAPPGPSVPRPGGPTAPGWEHRAVAPGVPTSLRFALPEAGTLCVFAPEAGGAARHALMSAAVAGATSGPLVVVTGDAELWAARPPHRRAALFDPQRLTEDDPESPRGRWAPHSGCADPVVATARARALLLPTVRPVADAEERGVRALAETLLRCWLRAAALDGRPFRHVARWAGSGSSGGGTGAGRQEAVTVLQAAAAHADALAGEDAWAGQLQAALLKPASALEAALGRIRAALGAVAELHVLAACTPESPAAALDPVALLDNGAAGSLYLLGRPGDGRLREPGEGTAPAVHSAMPLLSALVDDVVQRAWDTTGRTHDAGPTPAPVFVLDDVAAVAPFPTLPQLMRDGGTRGLRTVALLRSPEQARARWGEGAVHSLWTSADHCGILGPLSPAPLAALLASLGAAEHSLQQALGPDELLVLAGRHRTAQSRRFRISPPER